MTVYEAAMVTFGSISLVGSGIGAFAHWVKRTFTEKLSAHEKLDLERINHINENIAEMKDDVKYLVRREKSR